MKQLRYTNTVPPQAYWYEDGISYPLVSMNDSPSIDAFSRQRVSNPAGVYDAQLTYDLQPLIYQAVASGSGATITHDATNRCALHTFSNTSSGSAYMQSYEHIRYQPGKSQQAFVTFNFMAAAAGVTKFAGYSNGSDGVEFQLSGSTPRVAVLSSAGGGNEIVNQADWNLDKLNPVLGGSPSGYTLDITRAQIFVIDLQALYVGRVRVGFDIDGKVIYCHEFKHANLIYVPYMATANLPIRCGMTSTSAATTQMRFICSSVISEGGQEDTSGFAFAAGSASVTAASGARTHVISLRPLTTFNSLTNRTKFVLDSVEILNIGNSPVLWELCLGQAITSPSWAAANSTYSGFEVASGTISGAPGIVISRGYTASTANTKASTSYKLANRYPITLDAAGAVRALGTMSLIATGLGGSAAMYASLNWHELR